MPTETGACRETSAWFQSILAIALVPIVAVPVILTMLVLRLAQGAPVFFKQWRIGYRGRRFRILKLRTMRDERDGDGVLLPDDMRQTSLTRTIRRLRFDELVQLVNIIRGELAFIGPRPLTSQVLATFGTLANVRCRVRPGVTGWAQINGNTRLTDSEKLALDVWYVDHRSLGLDLFIAFATIRTILRGEHVHDERLERAKRHVKHRYGELALTGAPTGTGGDA
ncbi:sugar transferase [Pararhizobium mangrovi]|uniref:Sugar transferase n=2 Tax=Pararhizobium mangrovi TaxID=2590452 RepID=A0A506U6S0_9HYPH|nr:sugar transferase [Pararhizobium mangrovi]